MSAKVFRGSPNWKDGIPRNSKIRVESLPSQTLVYENDRVSGSVTVDLDPGYYAVVIKKFIGKNAMGRLSQIRWEEKFLHDITAEEFLVLSNLRPTNASGRLVGGGYTYFCNHPGCEYSCNNTIAMVLHELEHKGLTREDIVKDSDMLIDANHEAVKVVEESKKKGPKIGRSFNSET